MANGNQPEGSSPRAGAGFGSSGTQTAGLAFHLVPKARSPGAAFWPDVGLWLPTSYAVNCVGPAGTILALPGASHTVGPLHRYKDEEYRGRRITGPCALGLKRDGLQAAPFSVLRSS